MTALVARLAEIQILTTGQLRTELECLTGDPSRSWNRPYLIRKVSYLTQVEAQTTFGTDLPLDLTPPVRTCPRSGPLDAPIQSVPGSPVRDARPPRPGTVLVRHYKGLALTVRVLDRGFEWNGATYKSLSATARAITGQHMSGPFFFGLRKRSRSPK